MIAEEIIRLVSRVVHSARQVVFLVGSAIAAPQPEIRRRGVPTVSEMVRLISDDLRGIQATDLRDALANGENPYQVAFECLAKYKGQDQCNSLVQRAVLKCRKRAPKGLPLSEDQLRKLEEDLDGWDVPRGAWALGAIMAKYRQELDCKVLTTNFDPMIEIALRREGGDYFSTTLHRDGNLFASHGSVPQIIHLHGYWRGTDTLHTPHQLQRERPMLQSSLKRMLDESMLVVVGYGGWDDVFMRTLLHALEDHHGRLDVAWAFFPDDVEGARRSSPSVVNTLEPFFGERVHPYYGIEIHTFLLMLGAALQEKAKLATREGDVFWAMADVYIRGFLGDVGWIKEFESTVYSDPRITRDRFDFTEHVCRQLNVTPEVVRMLGDLLPGTLDRKARIISDVLRFKSSAEAAIPEDWVAPPESRDEGFSEMLKRQVLGVDGVSRRRRSQAS